MVMDDDELIAAIASGDGDGDDTALRELFSRHAPWLAVRLRKALPPDDVEAVLQEMACAVFAAGLVAFTIRGARTRLADDG